jgi:hypothetical protein
VGIACDGGGGGGGVAAAVVMAVVVVEGGEKKKMEFHSHPLPRSRRRKTSRWENRGRLTSVLRVCNKPGGNGRAWKFARVMFILHAAAWLHR